MEAYLLPLRPCSSCPRAALPRLLPHRSAAPRLHISSAARIRTPPRAANASTELNWEGGEVDVIGIGTRKDDIIDFSLDSPFSSSPRLRFWTIQSSNSSKVQLLHKSSEKDMETIIVDCPLCLHSCCPGIILVASAGYGLDDAVALDLLNGVKCTGGLSVAILLKPFCFEGQRRQQEVDNLMRKLQSSSQLYIVVETDALLRTNVETLEEAVKTVNYALLLAINMISILMTDKHAKFLDAPDEQVKEIAFAEILKLLGNYGESKVCYGAAYDVKSSIMQAISNSPFLASNGKGANGILILTVACATVMDRLELGKAVRFFRQITKCDKKIIFFGLYQAAIGREVVITSILVIGCNMQKAKPTKSILSGFFQAIPFLLSFLQRNFEATDDASVGLERLLSNGEILYDDDSLSESKAPYRSSNFFGSHSEEVGTEPNNQIFRTDKENKASFPAVDDESYVGEDSGRIEEQLGSWSLGPAFDFAQKWAKEQATLSGTATRPEGIDIFTLPVGVKHSGDCHGDYKLLEHADSETLAGSRGGTLDKLSFPSEESVGDTSLEALTDIYSSALSLSRGADMLFMKPAALSVRAASMLEAERESEKKWAAFVEMEYKGGLYRGRCQGGLPEGKGCLIFNDGSFYDGLWQFGKRSGLGTFCYSNGDMYQGAWRDDFMHGKGWFYFHTGDRWFANFWKGKVNGEGRFYSKSGSVFFGPFQNGWRHGEGLYIDDDGSRWSEFWEEGVLVRRTELD